MTFLFGVRSTERLSTCTQAMQRVARVALEIGPYDFTIVCGHRTEDAQDAAFFAGLSEKRWPDSTHNAMPSRAFDAAPWLIDSAGKGFIPWRDEGAFFVLAGVLLVAAKMEGVRIRAGYDWNRNGLSRDQGLHDTGHFEELLR